jgi:hypothetical protein
MTNARSSHSATLLPDGRVLISGGYPGTNAEIYDSATGRFTSAGNMIVSRQWHTATLLSNGTVLIAGGNLGESFDSSYVVGNTSAGLYNLATGIFSATWTMTRYRRSHKAGLLANGGVLIVPGSDANDFGTAELTIRTPDGSVLILGSLWDGIGHIPGAEVYDPASGTFSATGMMTTADPRPRRNANVRRMS